MKKNKCIRLSFPPPRALHLIPNPPVQDHAPLCKVPVTSCASRKGFGAAATDRALFLMQRHSIWVELT